MLPTFNTTNTTNTTQHNFVGKIFDRLCPGNSADTILHASESHMSPFELVLTACVVVAILSFLPALAKLERYVFDLDGDGKVDMDDVWFCLNRCCCRGTAPTTKTPTSKITPIIGKTEDSEDEGKDEDKEGDKDEANDEAKDEEEDTPTVLASDTLKSTLEDNTQVLDTTDSGDILQGWYSIVYTALFLYTAVMYMNTIGPAANDSGGTSQTILCKASQVVMLPLFKPASLSLWPAYMPLCQLAYWMDVSKRAAKNNGFTQYSGIVTPSQPFEFNRITLFHTYLVAGIMLMYAACASIFLGLLVVFGVFLVPVVFAIAFVFMYVPMQVFSGRCLYCCGAWCAMSRCGRREYVWVGDKWDGNWELKRDCMLNDAWIDVDQRKYGTPKFVLTPKKNNTTSTTNASGITDQIDLMALKALGTLYFALIAAAVYFTQFYFGGEEGNWVTLILSMVDEVPVFDIRNVLNLLDLRYVFSWPTMNVAFETPMVLSVGVLVMQYSTDLVRTLYIKYFQATDKVTSKDFARPMLLIIAAFSPGVWAQQGFQFVWDLGFGAWCCFGPLTRCCVKMKCFHAKGVGRFA